MRPGQPTALRGDGCDLNIESTKALNGFTGYHRPPTVRHKTDWANRSIRVARDDSLSINLKPHQRCEQRIGSGFGLSSLFFIARISPVEQENLLSREGSRPALLRNSISSRFCPRGGNILIGPRRRIVLPHEAPPETSEQHGEILSPVAAPIFKRRIRASILGSISVHQDSDAGWYCSWLCRERRDRE